MPLTNIESMKGTSSQPKLDIKDALNPAATPPHLDIASKTVLKEALNNFNGTLIVVSHDREFLQGLTSTVYGFRDKEIKEYLGDIDYFLEQHKMESLRDAEKKTVIKAEKDTSKKEAHQLSREQEKELKKVWWCGVLTRCEFPHKVV